MRADLWGVALSWRSRNSQSACNNGQNHICRRRINGRLHANLKIDSKSLESSQPSPRLFQRSPIFLTSADLSLIGPPYTGTHPGIISKQTRTSRTYRGTYNGKGKAHKTVERQPHDHESHI
jgi:hypothetical protein